MTKELVIKKLLPKKYKNIKIEMYSTKLKIYKVITIRF